jgi:hypothetical protein
VNDPEAEPLSRDESDATIAWLERAGIAWNSADDLRLAAQVFRISQIAP